MQASIDYKMKIGSRAFCKVASDFLDVLKQGDSGV